MAFMQVSAAVQLYIALLEAELEMLREMAGGPKESRVLGLARHDAVQEIEENKERMRLTARRDYERKCARLGKIPRPYVPQQTEDE